MCAHIHERIHARRKALVGMSQAAKKKEEEEAANKKHQQVRPRRLICQS